MHVGSGSRVSVLDDGRVVQLVTGRGSEFNRDTPPKVVVGDTRLVELSGYEIVFDLAVSGGRIATVVEGDGPADTTIAHGAFDAPFEQLPMSEHYRRVAWAGASLLAVTKAGALVDLKTSKTLASGIRDVATGEQGAIVSTGERLMVFGTNGLIDEVASRVGEVRAVAADRVSGGWLLASGRRVYLLESRRSREPTLLAELPIVVDKVRRSEAAIWVRDDERRLHRVDASEAREITKLSGNAWYWDDFDANASGAVYESGSALHHVE